MNIFLREFRANRKSLLIWSGIVIVFSLVGFSKFTAFFENPQLTAMLDAMPPALLDAMSINAFNLTTVSGFFGMMYLYNSLILTIAAIMWGSVIISKEERDRTVEFSLTLPVTRTKIVLSKVAVVIVNCMLLLLVTWGITLVSAQQFDPDAAFYKFVSISMLAYFILQMVFMALGVLLACALKRHKRSGSMAVSLVLVSYFLSMVSGIRSDLEFIRYLTPFKYFDPVLLLHESKLEIPFVLLSAAIFLAALAAAHMAYQKRDLYI